MNFGDILDQWEKGPRSTNISKKIPPPPMTQKKEWHDEYFPNPEDTRLKEKKQVSRGISRKKLEKMDPQDEIDLHGQLKEDIASLLGQFIRQCRKKKIQKILIIHGKGLHSPNGAVLRPVIHDFLSHCIDVVDWGQPPARLGGSGATWAILRR